MKTIYLSPSQIIDLSDCRMKHALKSIYKVKVAIESVNLAYGKVIDTVVREYLTALTLGERTPNMVGRFTDLWDNVCRTKALSYSSTKTSDDFMTMGKLSMEEFPIFWEASDYSVALDASSKPMLDLKLKAQIGNGLTLVGILDLAVFDREMDFGIFDLKTAAVEHTLDLALQSDQLTSYDILCRAHASTLGVIEPQFLGFLDILKRKKEAKISIVRSSARNNSQIDEFINKLYFYADDIRNKRFYKESRAAYNSPCNQCDYAGLCIHGDNDGLIIPKDVKLPLAA